MKPSDIAPIDLTNDTKVYQFMKQTESENRTSKLSLEFDKKSHAKLLKAIENWMKWHISKLVESQKSVGKKNKKECTH
jgi:hypothetical protein